ncbi:MAG: hypothetical protein JSW27_12310 [Phycisphaerales bacterium]|nr:MAG: hypothetical protein JSW27_12310 [Phycisphaerales bacterium]
MKTLLLIIALSTLPSPVQVRYSGGSGTVEDPYEIATVADLILLGETAEDYDKHFVLTADVDLDPNLPGGKVFDRAVIAFDANDAERGFQGTAFRGIFDGNDHTISHLTITGESYLGLFGQLESGASVNNVGLTDVSVAGSKGYVGGLAGYNGGHLTHCYCTGKDLGFLPAVVIGDANDVGGALWRDRGQLTGGHWTGAVTGGSNVGGMVGYNRGRVTGCYWAGTVSGRSNVGGLTGCNARKGKVIDGRSHGCVTGAFTVGGLVGRNSGTIDTCSSTGGTQGGTGVGGLVGSNSGAITDSYANGYVCQGGNIYFSPCSFGGLVAGNSGTITNCYSTAGMGAGILVGYFPPPFAMRTAVWVPHGSVERTRMDLGVAIDSCSTEDLLGPAQRLLEGGDTGRRTGKESYSSVTWVQGIEEWESRGGLVAINSGRVTQSFWDVQASGLSESDGGVGLTTDEMHSATTFLEAGWDFIDETDNGTDDLWWILEGQDYPRLWWELSASDLVVLVVDDFESYDHEDNRIYETWRDGWFNGTGSIILPWWGPLMEPPVHSGRQSMPLGYDNDAPPYYSEVCRTWCGCQAGVGPLWNGQARRQNPFRRWCVWDRGGRKEGGWASVPG